MNSKSLLFGLFLILFLFVFLFSQEDDFPVLTGAYLGQKPPDMTPGIFAPGIISTDQNELNSIFSPKGDEFFYAIYSKERKYVMMYTKQIKGAWTKPEVFPFSGEFTDVDMAFSPDGNTFFFCSNRPSIWERKQMDIWYCVRASDGWSEPQNLGKPVNSAQDETYPWITENGTMYFASSREGGMGDKDLYYSTLINGKYSDPIHLGSAINSEYGEGDTYVAPDEKYLIICSWGRPDSRGRGDLYISFKKKDDTWSKAVNMGDTINTASTEYCPAISPDGNYLFFTSGGDIYWVDAKILEKYRPATLR